MRNIAQKGIVIGMAIFFGSQIIAPRAIPAKTQNHTIVAAKTVIAPTIGTQVTLATVTPEPTLSEEPSSSDPVEQGRQMAAAKGWTGYEWESLYALWQRESGWNSWAWNNSSGAGGLPQALPFSKMGCALGDTICQIQWGLGYIANRYGDPANAWYHEKIYGWY